MEETLALYEDNITRIRDGMSFFSTFFIHASFHILAHISNLRAMRVKNHREIYIKVYSTSI